MFSVLSYVLFFKQAMDDHYLRNFGCVMPFHTNKPKEKPCTLNNSMLDPFWEFLDNGAFKLFCQMPCASMEVTFPAITDGVGSPDEAYVKLYLLTVVKVQTSYWSYSIISLLAEVGGYLGLLLGMSLLDITKVIDWFCLKFNIHP